MKKIAAVMLILSIILTACSSTTNDNSNTGSSQQPIENSNYTNEQSQQQSTSEEAPTEGVDIDLTEMTTTMIYSQVFDMVMNAQNYEGKVIKMQGLYNPLYFEPTDSTYHLMVITDATGCCPQGVEFVITNQGQEYPELNTEIQVTGVFEIYQEGENLYFRIVSDELVIIS